tara:strand:- start:244 stop:444 length:201 start_codon:yes stop_codon:yes gene_type:complete
VLASSAGATAGLFNTYVVGFKRRYFTAQATLRRIMGIKHAAAPAAKLSHCNEQLHLTTKLAEFRIP